MSCELRQLVHEEHSAVREGDLARSRNGSTADEPGRRDRVMRSAEGPARSEPVVRHPRHARDLRDLDGFVEARRREDRGQPAREHRLARPGRADHQQVVTTGGRDLERPLRVVLAAHVGEVEPRLRLVRIRTRTPLRERHRLPLPAQKRPHALEVGHGDDFHSFDQRGLLATLERDDEPADALPPRGESHREHSAHRAQRAAERQLAADRGIGCRIGRDLAAGAQDGDRQSEVEDRAGLADVRRRQVRGDPPAREVEARVRQRGANPLARLAHRGIGEADDRERGQAAAANVDLDLHPPAVDAVDGEGCDASGHRATVGCDECAK